MPALALSTPAEALRFLQAQGCRALESDSRRVRAGDGFIAWPGHVHDGRAFVPQALAAGAAACLVEAEGALAYPFDDRRIAALRGLKAATGAIAAGFHGDPSRRLDVIATTGTNGKTSTAWWVAQALSLLGRRAGLIGTLGVGVPGAMLSTGLTTPDPVRLQAALAGFVAEGCAACAIEASSIGIVEERLAGTRIAVALFTNFTRDHLDYHGSMEAYWAAKRALFDWPGLRAAVVNIDDAQGARLAAELAARAEGGAAALDLWTVSLRDAARLRAGGLRHTAEGLAFEAIEAEASVAVTSALFGEYNASNLLVVIGALRALGMPLVEIAPVLALLSPVPGRLQPVPQPAPGAAPHQPRVLVDYAHTPDALDKVLHALRPVAATRGGALWCLFGCGGNRDATKRPLMGAIAARLADRVVLTSDNPRDESPALILAQIRAGIGEGAATVEVIEDRAAAITHALGAAAPADVVLLAGKGHEDYQEIAGVKRPFSDLEVAKTVLAARERGVSA